jgi:hypothetical protein
MLDNDFCTFLEFHLTKAFSNSNDPSLKGFWCDGVLLPTNENTYSKKSINDTREIMLKVFIGKEGQNEYSMLLKFGNKSLSRYAKDLDIKNCVPEFDENDWYEIDTKTKKIVINLL